MYDKIRFQCLGTEIEVVTEYNTCYISLIVAEDTLAELQEAVRLCRREVENRRRI